MNKNREISNGMKIGIDARLWNQSGVGRYTRNLVYNLLKIDKKNSYVLFVRKQDYENIKYQISLHFGGQANIKYNNKLKIVSVNVSWHSISEQIQFPRIIEKENLDLMHFPYQIVPILYKAPFVVTIHDLILHHFMSGEASTQPYWMYGFKMLAYRMVIYSGARKAKKIISVSKSTKNEIIDHLRIAPSKIEVIYEAADDFVTDAKATNFKDYFLFVGNVYPHKNVETLIKAFKLIAKDKNVKLIFVGREDYFYKKMKKKVGDLLQSGRVIFVHDADDQTLLSLYKDAICLIRPSLMEGFSLPPLEALSNGCLVIASDIPVHREIFEDGILYFNPREHMDLVNKMEYILSLDKKSKDQMVIKGLKKSKEFSWNKTAQQTLRVYETL
ncbi:MAG: Glycosyl transferase group 1 [Microgenomates group bacterium GW2011_GWA2_37_6]|nr:MAG: Glycosyl transferase group 1 [Microgenomates group bacterium GW2011_GWA2_37_6]